jgi:hypothetical protein
MMMMMMMMMVMVMMVRPLDVYGQTRLGSIAKFQKESSVFYHSSSIVSNV